MFGTWEDRIKYGHYGDITTQVHSFSIILLLLLNTFDFYSYAGTQGLIFVVDCADRDRIDEARTELHRIINDREMRDAIILIFANKQDLPDGKHHDEIKNPIIYFNDMLLLCSHETTRNTRKTWSNSNKRQKLVCATVVRNKRRWTLRRSDVVNVQPQIMRIIF